MKLITVDEIMALEPCQPGDCDDGGYPRHYVEELVGDGIAPREILELHIPHTDKLWCLIRLIPGQRARAMAVEMVKKHASHRKVDDRLLDAIRVADLHSLGTVCEDDLTQASASALRAWQDAIDKRNFKIGQKINDVDLAIMCVYLCTASPHDALESIIRVEQNRLCNRDENTEMVIQEVEKTRI